MAAKGKITKTKIKKKSQVAKLPHFMSLWFADYYLYISVGFSACLVSVGIIMLVLPQFSVAHAIAKKDIPESLTHQQEFQTALAYLKKLDAAYRETNKQDIQRLGNILPTAPGTPELLTVVEGIANESAAQVKDIQFSIIESSKAIEAARLAGIEIPKGIGIVEVDITVGATPYASIKRLIGNIEQSVRLLDIVSLSYSPVDEDYVISLRSYFRPEKK